MISDSDEQDGCLQDESAEIACACVSICIHICVLSSLFPEGTVLFGTILRILQCALFYYNFILTISVLVTPSELMNYILAT